MTARDAGVVERALDALRSGDPHAGEVLVMEPLVRALAREGPRTRAHARASVDVATYLLALGDFERAEDALATAVAVAPTTDDERREHAGWLLTYAEVVGLRGRPREAARWAGQAHRLARDVLGERHERTVGAGLVLAELALRGGVDDAVRQLTEDLLLVGWGGADDRAARALVWYGLAHGPAEVWDVHLQAAPAARRAAVEERALAAAQTHPAGLVLPVLVALHGARGGAPDTEPRALGLLVAIGRVAAELGDRALQIVALRALEERLEGLGRSGDRARVLIQLAAAVEAAGDAALADSIGAQAAAVAEGDDEAADEVALAEGRRHLAGGRLDAAGRALARASRGASGGRAALSLGLALAHDGHPGAAITVLDEALRRLPAESDEASLARHHLGALHAGRPCGCGEVSRALTEDLAARLREAVPDLPVERAAVALVDGRPHVDLAVGRAPTPDERRHVERLLQQTVAAWRRRVRS